MEYRYYIVDAFTRRPFQGAPIAVFPEAGDLTGVQMQMLARELNQAETVFILRSDGSHMNEMRIFTPDMELDFGGHPVIAASYVLFKDNKISTGSYQLRLPVGSISIDVAEDEKIQFTIQSETKLDGFVPSNKELGEILNLDENDIDQSKNKVMISGCGENYLIVPVKSIDQMDRARFNEEKWTMSFVATLAKQILLFCENRDDALIDYNARLFGKGIAHNEDPPIGTSIPAFGHYVFSNTDEGLHTARVQRGDGGRRISMIEVELNKYQGDVSDIKVGGYAVQVGEGSIRLD